MFILLPVCIAGAILTAINGFCQRGEVRMNPRGRGWGTLISCRYIGSAAASVLKPPKIGGLGAHPPKIPGISNTHLKIFPVK